VAEGLPSADYEVSLQSEGYRAIAGVDEVGRGSWAGPVVAAAVILPRVTPCVRRRLAGLRDSKTIPSAERVRLAGEIRALGAVVGLGWATHHVIDRDGIANANRWAMLRAVRRLPVSPDLLLLDHLRLGECPIPQIALPHGDSRVLSIAAASIIAKVTRDRWMERCAERYGDYGFDRHKGYGTCEHRAALQLLGPSLLHRRSFAPCAGLSE